MSTMGYLANVTSVPPLIFKFQFHPEILSEKKSFEYTEDPEDVTWKFDQAEKAANKKGLSDLGAAAAGVGGLFKDLAELGSLLTATKAQRPGSGKPRTFALEFALDARPKPDDPGLIGKGASLNRIEPDLAVLRSFMNPTFDLLRDIGTEAKQQWKKPPTCQLKLGDIRLTCVMTDLNIKVTKFKADLTPERAEVSLTLAEQTASLSTVVDALDRGFEVYRSYGQLTRDEALEQVPVVGALKTAFF